MFDFDVVTDSPQTSRLINPADNPLRAPAAPLPAAPAHAPQASVPPAAEPGSSPGVR